MHFPPSKIPNSWRIFDGSRVLVCWCPGLTDELGLNFTPQDESICDDGRGSRAPTAQRLPCCHAPNIHGAILPSGQTQARSGQMFRFQRKFQQELDGNIWARAAWLVLCFVLLNDTVLWQCHAMSCDVSDIVISVTTDSHQPVLCPAKRHWGSVGRIQSNVARYLDKPGLNMIPACWAATWPPYFRGHPAVMQTVRDGRRGLAILWPAPLGNQ